MLTTSRISCPAILAVCLVCLACLAISNCFVCFFITALEFMSILSASYSSFISHCGRWDGSTLQFIRFYFVILLICHSLCLWNWCWLCSLNLTFPDQLFYWFYLFSSSFLKSATFTCVLLAYLHYYLQFMALLTCSYYSRLSFLSHFYFSPCYALHWYSCSQHHFLICDHHLH